MYNPNHMNTTAADAEQQKKKQLEEVWKQVRQVQNQTAAAAREYRDVRAQQSAVAPSETAAERYQHRQVQKDLARAKEMADGLARTVERTVLPENESVCVALEGGIAMMGEEKARLEARLKQIDGQMDEIQRQFEAELTSLDEQRKKMQTVAVAYTLPGEDAPVEGLRANLGKY